MSGTLGANLIAYRQIPHGFFTNSVVSAAVSFRAAKGVHAHPHSGKKYPLPAVRLNLRQDFGRDGKFFDVLEKTLAKSRAPAW